MPPRMAADDKITLAGGLEVSKVGIGAWSWGDSLFWGYDKNMEEDAYLAYKTTREAGINLIDTAEVYGGVGNDWGLSEKLCGKFDKRYQDEEKGEGAVIASKFAVIPPRFTRDAVVSAVKKSNERLGVSCMDLYQLHWPGFIIDAALWDGLADAADMGLVKSVGVSNYSAKRLREAHKALAARGVPLATNQVQYSLLHRNIERNGVKEACEDLGVNILAYSPLAQGLLTGRYSSTNLPKGPRANIMKGRFSELDPLLVGLKEVGEAHGEKSRSQVALNWLIAKGTIPIPGARNAAQAGENAGAMGWELSGEEVEKLDALSLKLEPFPGMPLAAM